MDLAQDEGAHLEIALILVAVVVGIALVGRVALVLHARRRYPIRELPGFLSDEECAHLIEVAQPRLRQSTIVSDGERGTLDTQRKSGSAFLDQAGDRIIQAVKRRIAAATDTPVENQERLQVTHYHEGERYAPHFDALGASGLDTGAAGDRVWTVILYLNDDYTGGATVFPRLRRKIQPSKGKAVVFRNLTSDCARHDPLAIHAGAAVHGGEKWLSNQWIRERRRHRPPAGGQRRPKKTSRRKR